MEYKKLKRTWKNKLGADEDVGGDHIYYNMRIGEFSHRIGKVSHSTRGSDTVDDYIMRDTTRRMKVSKPELVEIVGCSISKGQYVVMWQERYNEGTS